MTLAKNEHGEVRSVSGIILYAKHTVVSNSLWLLEIIPRTKLSGTVTINNTPKLALGFMLVVFQEL
jgi:hypothetical protein